MRMKLRPRSYPRVVHSKPRRVEGKRAPNEPSSCQQGNIAIRLSMQDLPLEVIYHISTFVDIQSTDIGSLLLTCRQVSLAVEYRRYSAVVVVGEQGTRLMATLISGTPTSRRYCKRVKCLWFRGWSDGCMYVNSTLLSRALARLDNLVAFWIESSPLDTSQLLTRMKLSGVCRESLHPASLIPDINRSRHPFSKLTLPNLRVMRLTGEPMISALFYCRPLKELDMNFYLQAQHFADFVGAVEGSVLRHTLETLSIKLARSLDIDLAFPMLCRALPCVSKLSVEQTSINFEAILDHLALNCELLPLLKTLVSNRRYSHPIIVTGSALPKAYPISDVMDEYLTRITRFRPGLETVGLGKVIWQAGMDGRFFRRSLPSYPDYWASDFGEVFRYGRFDPNLLPNYTIEIVDNS